MTKQEWEKVLKKNYRKQIEAHRYSSMKRQNTETCNASGMGKRFHSGRCPFNNPPEHEEMTREKLASSIISALASETCRVDEYDTVWNEPATEGGKGLTQRFRRGSVTRKSCRRRSTPAGSGVSLPSLRAVRQREAAFNEIRLIYSIVKRNGRTADKATDALRRRPWQAGREITQKLTQTMVSILSRVWWKREEAKRAPPAYAGINTGRGFYTFLCRTGEG